VNRRRSAILTVSPSSIGRAPGASSACHSSPALRTRPRGSMRSIATASVG
jgi:hypothetical protein